jgi:hypothetical protein
VEERDFNAIRACCLASINIVICAAGHSVVPFRLAKPAWLRKPGASTACLGACTAVLVRYAYLGSPLQIIEEIPAWAQSCLNYAEAIHDEAMAVAWSYQVHGLKIRTISNRHPPV